METIVHNRLKHMCAGWLRDQGYLAASREVRSPIARWVLDVAGWRDSWWDGQHERHVRLDEPQTIIVECKQSRADFLRDSRHLERLLQLRDRYQIIRRSQEEHRIKHLEPHLRRSGSALFPELEEWDFASSTLTGYRRTIRRLEQLEHRIHGQTKFHRMARYRLADTLLIAAPAGLIGRRELPAGWGLLEFDLDAIVAAGDDKCATVHAPTQMWLPSAAVPASARYRQTLLRNIAIAASARAFRDAYESTRRPIGDDEEQISHVHKPVAVGIRTGRTVDARPPA